jgi:hypothetical protein
MIVGPGRFRIAKVASPGPGASSEGVVVQAVLVMALVTTIGVLLVASRVAGSRQSATAASLSNAARQAAEFGFAEIVAEMNRDSKSYLWVTKFGEWTNVRAGDLEKCGVMSTADSEVGRKITGSDLPIAVSGELPNSSAASLKLSYELTDYQVPTILTGSLPASLASACREDGKFGNLIGGSGEFTIVGTVKRLDGSTVSSYTLKRKVSVGRAAPIFNNPIGAIPSSRVYSVGDSRFPPFPSSNTNRPYYKLNCYNPGATKVTSLIRCESSYNNPSTGEPTATTIYYDFLNDNNDTLSSSLSAFPFVRPIINGAQLSSNQVTLTFAAPHGISRGQNIKVASLPNPFGRLNSTLNSTFTVTSTPTPFKLAYVLSGINADIQSQSVTAGVVETIGGKSSLKLLPDICGIDQNKVQCFVSSMDVGVRNSQISSLMSISTLYPVEIFLKNNLTIANSSTLNGKDWTKFRVYGVASGDCPVDFKTNSPQVISISGVLNGNLLQSNLLNAFLWLPSGQVQYRGDAFSSQRVTVMALVGSDCTKSDFSNNPSPLFSTTSSVTNRAVLKGLGGAYGFDGLFAGEFRVFYRGFGGAEQSLSPSR